MTDPKIWKLKDLSEHLRNGPRACIEGKYLPARPAGFWGMRHKFRAAWLVFTGKADALIWPGGQ